MAGGYSQEEEAIFKIAMQLELDEKFLLDSLDEAEKIYLAQQRKLGRKIVGARKEIDREIFDNWSKLQKKEYDEEISNAKKAKEAKERFGDTIHQNYLKNLKKEHDAEIANAKKVADARIREEKRVAAAAERELDAARKREAKKQAQIDKGFWGNARQNFSGTGGVGVGGKVGSVAGYMLAGGVVGGIAAAGAAAMAVMRDVIAVTKEYDAALTDLQVKAGATDAELKNMESVIFDTASATKFLVADLIEASTVMSKLGKDSAEISSLLPDVANAAAATGSNVSTMANTVVVAMNAFNLETAESAHLADVLTHAFLNSSLSIDKFNTATSYAAAGAQAANVTFEEMTASLEILADQGVTASKAGTGLRKIFAAVADSGMTYDELLKSISNTTIEYGDVMDMVGRTAANQLYILANNYDELGVKVKEFTEINGEAQIAAIEQMDTIKAKQDKFKNNWHDFFYAKDGIVTVALKGWYDWWNAAINPEGESKARGLTIYSKNKKVIDDALERNESADQFFETLKKAGVVSSETRGVEATRARNLSDSVYEAVIGINAKRSDKDTDASIAKADRNIKKFIEDELAKANASGGKTALLARARELEESFYVEGQTFANQPWRNTEALDYADFIAGIVKVQDTRTVEDLIASMNSKQKDRDSLASLGLSANDNELKRMDTAIADLKTRICRQSPNLAMCKDTKTTRARREDVEIDKRRAIDSMSIRDFEAANYEIEMVALAVALDKARTNKERGSILDKMSLSTNKFYTDKVYGGLNDNLNLQETQLKELQDELLRVQLEKEGFTTSEQKESLDYKTLKARESNLQSVIETSFNKIKQTRNAIDDSKIKAAKIQGTIDKKRKDEDLTILESWFGKDSIEDIMPLVEDLGQEMLNAFNMIQDMKLDKLRSDTEEELEIVQDRYDKEIEMQNAALANGNVSQEQAAAAAIASNKKRVDEENKLNKELFEAEKKAEIGRIRAQNLQSIAEATINILQYKGHRPILAASLIAGTTALIVAQGQAQIQAKKKEEFVPQQYADGGWIDGRLHSQGGTIVEAEKGEFIVSRRGMQRFGTQIEAMNDAAVANPLPKFAAGGYPSGVIASYDTTSVQRALDLIVDNTATPVRAFITTQDLRKAESERRALEVKVNY